MFNIFLNSKTNYNTKYTYFINKYLDCFKNTISASHRFNVCTLIDNNEYINKSNIKCSDLMINSIFNNSEKNNIIIHYQDNQNGLIKEISNKIMISFNNSHFIPTQINTSISNDKDNSTDSDLTNIIIEYNISEKNIMWLFNDIILNTILTELVKIINDYSDKLISNNFNFIDTHTKAIELFTDDKMENVKKMVPLIKKYQKDTGLLTSLSLAQFIYETDYGTSELLLNGNNCFGMKIFISNNDWYGSTWNNNNNIYTKITKEENELGKTVNIEAQFRKYDDIEKSIVDHCSYLLNSRKNNGYRYPNINKCKNYKEACMLLTDGGYSSYREYSYNVIDIIKNDNLDKYDD